MGVMVIGINERRFVGLRIGKTTGCFGPPSLIDLIRAVCRVQTLEQCVGHDRALFGIERECVSDQACRV